jgi:GNAT superfamily N-acetyltransferase
MFGVSTARGGQILLEMSTSIVPFARELASPLLEMWRAYQEFYQVNDIDDGRNRAHVENIVNNPSLGCIHLALLAGDPVGFSTLYFTFTSTRACKIAVLNDLFVVPQRRRGGVGRALLEHALAYAREQGIRSVRWSTSVSNAGAQKLYADYAVPTQWNMYNVDVSQAKGQ